MNSDDTSDSGPAASKSCHNTISRRDWLTTLSAGALGVTVNNPTVSQPIFAVGPSEQKWVFKTDAPLTSSPTVVDDTVYLGGPELYAVDVATGDQQWAFKSSYVMHTPTVNDGTVYVGGMNNDERNPNGKLFAVDAATGERQWTFETGWYVQSSPTVVDDTVYVGSSDDNLYAVDAATGQEQWAFETNNQVNSSPTVVDSTVYVGSWDGNLYAVDVATGDKQWAFETDGKVYSSPTVIDDTVYVGSHDSNLYAVDAATGQERWIFETGSKVDSSPTVADGTVYIKGDELYAVDAATGQEQWAFDAGSVGWSSPTVADNTVYIGSHDFNLYAVDAATGDKQWAFKTNKWVWSSPTVADGTVYVGGWDGNLYAVGTDHTKSSSGSRTRLETLGHHEQSPTARFSAAPAQPITGTLVTFDASNSSDEYEIAKYEWDFTNDGTIDATGRQVTHTYDDAGTYTVTLTVIDTDGATATTTQTVSVSEPETTEQETSTSGDTTFSYTPSQPTVNTTVTFDANNFPPDAAATSYQWDFNSDGTPDAFGSKVRHIFSSGGTHTVTLTAKLESGKTKTARRSVLVNTPPEPAFTVSPSPAIINEPTTFDAGKTTDSTGAVQSYEWDFDGDGTIDKTGRAVTHTFSKQGRPTVTLRTTDSQGVTATQSRSVTVQRAATFSLQLRDTTITLDEQTTVAISVNSLLGSERLFTQLELDVPSGWDVTFVDAPSAGGGTATKIFEIQPGQTRTIRVRIAPNDTGEFTVAGRAFYYVGDPDQSRHTTQLSSGPLTVKSPNTRTPTETNVGTSGFGLRAGVSALGAGLGLFRTLDLLDISDELSRSEED